LATNKKGPPLLHRFVFWGKIYVTNSPYFEEEKAEFARFRPKATRMLPVYNWLPKPFYFAKSSSRVF
jgi:hypothetical protein